MAKAVSRKRIAPWLLPPTVTWCDVLLSHQPLSPWYGTVDKYWKEVVVPSGYKYFEWNGLIYRVLSEPGSEATYVCTEVPASELDERVVRRTTPGERLGRWWSSERVLRVRRVLTHVFGYGAWLYLCLALWWVGRISGEQYVLIVGPLLVMANLAALVMVRK